MPNKAINADFYCQQLNRLEAELTSKWLADINRRRFLFYHTRTHVVLKTLQKLLHLGWKVLPHLIYSPDLAPLNYHLFQSLHNAFTCCTFNDVDAVKMAL